MSQPVTRKEVHPVVAAIVIAAVVAGVIVFYYYATEVPRAPAGTPKRVIKRSDWAGEEKIGPASAAVKIQGFFLPTTGESAKQALRDLAKQYPEQVYLYLGSPNMGIGQRAGAKDGDVFLNGKRVATGGDVATLQGLVQEKLGTGPK